MPSGTRNSAGWRRVWPRSSSNGLKLKYHYAIADYLMRAARHVASKTDVEQSYAVGRAAVDFALQGKNGVMVTIERQCA